MVDIYHDLYKIAKEVSFMSPYCFRSDYYAVRDAAEALSKALPEEEQIKFMKYVGTRIKNLSNYAGD